MDEERAVRILGRWLSCMTALVFVTGVIGAALAAAYYLLWMQ